MAESLFYLQLFISGFNIDTTLYLLEYVVYDSVHILLAIS
jgi:hypothetical protein